MPFSLGLLIKSYEYTISTTVPRYYITFDVSSNVDVEMTEHTILYTNCRLMFDE